MVAGMAANPFGARQADRDQVGRSAVRREREVALFAPVGLEVGVAKKSRVDPSGRLPQKNGAWVLISAALK